MDDEPIDPNCESGGGDFQMDDMSDDSGNPGPSGADNMESSAGGWIHWFCSLEGHEYMVEVDEDYIRDPFNLYGLQGALPQLTKEKFKHLIKMILSPSSPNEEDLADEQFLELN